MTEEANSKNISLTNLNILDPSLPCPDASKADIGATYYDISDCSFQVNNGIEWVTLSGGSGTIFGSNTSSNIAGGSSVIAGIGITSSGSGWIYPEELTKAEEDKKLREQYPVLQELYEEYETVKRMLRDEKLDDSFEQRVQLGRDLVRKDDEAKRNS